ncbi:unnamed protein product, partial [Linum tenue]
GLELTQQEQKRIVKEGDGDESLGERCEEGVGEEGEECLTRRTLQAHLDYTPPPTSPSPSQP